MQGTVKANMLSLSLQATQQLRQLQASGTSAPAAPCGRCPRLDQLLRELEAQLALRSSEAVAARAQATEARQQVEALRGQVQQAHADLGAQVRGQGRIGLCRAMGHGDAATWEH